MSTSVRSPQSAIARKAYWLSLHEVAHMYGSTKLAKQVSVAIKRLGHDLQWAGYNPKTDAINRKANSDIENILNAEPYYRRQALQAMRLRSTRILRHVALSPANKGERVYYTSDPSPRNGYSMMLCIDIDNHHGAPVEQVEILRERITMGLVGSTIYWERSTNGNGLHGYLTVKGDTSELVPSREAVDSLASLAVDLRAWLRAQTAGLQVKVDLCGTPCIIRNRKVVNAGTLAKVPRPQTREQAEQFLESAAKRMDWTSLVQVVGTGEDSSITGCSSKEGKVSLHSDTYYNKHSILVDCLASIRAESDAKVRRSRWVWYYCTYLTDCPTVQECDQLYADYQMSTNSSDSNRVKHFKNQIQYWSGRAKKLQTKFSFSQTIDLLSSMSLDIEGWNSHLKAEYTSIARIRLQDVAAVLYLLTGEVLRPADSPARQGTFGQAVCLKSIRTMQEEGYPVRALDNKRFAAIMRKLEELNLIVCLNRGYIPGGPKKGISRKYCIGSCHPLFIKEQHQ